MAQEGSTSVSPNLSNANSDELYAALEEIQQTQDAARVEELLAQASLGLSELHGRLALMGRIVAAGHTRQQHNFGTLGD